MPLRSREYEERIRTMGFERATAWAMMDTIERLSMLERDIKSLKEDTLVAAKLLNRIVDGALVLKRKVEELHRRDQVDESHPVPADDRIN